MAAIELHVFLGGGDQESTRLGEDVEVCEIDITAIEQIECSGLKKQLIEEIDVVNLAPGHVNTGRNFEISDPEPRVPPRALGKSRRAEERALRYFPGGLHSPISLSAGGITRVKNSLSR